MNGPEISRREALQWVLAASASAAMGSLPLNAADADPANARPYGTDPLLNKSYKPGDFWPLTLSESQRTTVTALCDLILPADERSPAASALGVPSFIDEWISAPYPQQRADRETVLAGLKWLEAESDKRFRSGFARASVEQQAKIADDVCHPPRAKAEFAEAAKFFALFRNLTVTGYYTTPVGMRDVGYRGNVPLARFEGAPKEVLAKLGLG